MTYPFRRALVTGASSGIGEAIARELGAAGVPLVITARRADRLADLAHDFPGTEVLAADLADPAGLAVVEARVRAADDPVDLLVNNAGFGTSGPMVAADPDRASREIALNVTALTRLTTAALPRMCRDRRGWILNVSSVVAFQPAPKLAVYAATKAYVQSFTESVHEEARLDGVHVTALCPGLTRTEFQSVSSAADHQRSYPGWLWLTSAEVAQTGLADVVRGKAVSVPGWKYRTMVAVSGVTPRGVTRWVSGRVLRR